MVQALVDMMVFLMQGCGSSIQAVYVADLTGDTVSGEQTGRRRSLPNDDSGQAGQRNHRRVGRTLTETASP